MEGSGKIRKNKYKKTPHTMPPTDTRTTIRLSDKDLRTMHRILQQLIKRRSYAQFLDLKHADVEAARDLIERIPHIVPSPAEASA